MTYSHQPSISGFPLSLDNETPQWETESWGREVKEPLFLLLKLSPNPYRWKLVILQMRSFNSICLLPLIKLYHPSPYYFKKIK